MQVENAPSFSRQYHLPTRANSPDEDQLSKVFDMWVENNTGVQEHNFFRTHPEAGQAAFAMIEQARKDIYGEAEQSEAALPGSLIPLGSEGDGQFAVGLHPIDFSGDGIVAQEAVAKLTVDTTPGVDGTTYIISTP